MTEPTWLDYNRRGWDERVDLHLEAESYDLAPLRSGHGQLTPIEEADWAGRRAPHTASPMSFRPRYTDFGSTRRHSGWTRFFASRNHRGSYPGRRARVQ
jgi:hypothetical protein